MNEPPVDVESLASQIVASFSRAPLPDAAGRTPAELGLLTQLREVFLAAGAEQLRRWHAERWLQLGVSFADPDQAAALRSSGVLAEAVERWLDAGRVRQFVFLWKPPGLRVRFSGADPRTEAEIVALFDQLRADGQLDRFEFGVYDQETHQFGGVAGIELFHRWSTADCRSILQFEALERAGRTTVDRSVLSMWALNDLVKQVAGDVWEEWDTWCGMWLTGRLPEPGSPLAEALQGELEQNRPLLEQIVFRPDELRAELGPEEQALAERWSRANHEVAEGFRRAARDRTLEVGPRKIVPFFVIFHWNRFGVEIEEQVAFSSFFHELLNPKRDRR